MTIFERPIRHSEEIYRFYPTIGRVHAELGEDLQAVWGDPVINIPGPDFSRVSDDLVTGFHFTGELGIMVVRVTFTEGPREYRLRCIYSKYDPATRARAIIDGFA